MRKNITGLLVAVIAMSSCTPSTSTPTPSTTSLNATETALKGKWYLIKEEWDWVSPSGYDTTYTTTSTASYIDFLSDPLNAPGLPDYYKKAQDARITILGLVSGTSSIHWFYDQSSSRLVIGNVQYEIMSQTSTALKIKKTDINMTTIQTFKK